MLTDVSEMLKPAEKVKADKWKETHKARCASPPPKYIVISNVSGFGYRLKVLCQSCGAKEDVSDPSRDPAPKH